jgi:stage II sporulation protein D
MSGTVAAMLRRGLVAVAAALAGAGLAAAQAPTPPTAVVASTLLISGHGWGHGLGMAQWGAQGYAQHGWTYDRILAHYYPGTQLAAAPPGKIRVLLADGKKSLKLSSAAQWTVRDASGADHALAPGAVTITADGILTTSDPAAENLVLTLPLTFRPLRAPLELDRPYRGTIEVSSVNGKLQAVNSVGLEAYLKGVVPAEMPFNWTADALKAQAVAARSYALFTRAVGRSYDVFDDVRSQVYLGLNHERPSTNAAVDATRSQVVTYGGKVAFTMFHSSSGGRTVAYSEVYPGNTKYPYLASVDDPYDTISPHHNWGPVLVDGTKAAKALGVPGGQLVDLQATAGPSGHVARAVAQGLTSAVEASGAKVRAQLGLRSTWFSVDGVLSLSRPYGPLSYGSATTVSGRVRGAAGISVEQRSGSTFWQPFSPVTPAGDGTFGFTVNPTATTDYRLVTGALKAFPLRVSVAPVVTLARSPDNTALFGTTNPALTGTVEVQRENGIVWTTAATAAVTAGSFSVPLPLAPGTYRARFAPGGGLVAGTSPPLLLG